MRKINPHSSAATNVVVNRIYAHSDNLRIEVPLTDKSIECFWGQVPPVPAS